MEIRKLEVAVGDKPVMVRIGKTLVVAKPAAKDEQGWQAVLGAGLGSGMMAGAAKAGWSGFTTANTITQPELVSGLLKIGVPADQVNGAAETLLPHIKAAAPKTFLVAFAAGSFTVAVLQVANKAFGWKLRLAHQFLIGLGFAAAAAIAYLAARWAGVLS